MPAPVGYAPSGGHLSHLGSLVYSAAMRTLHIRSFRTRYVRSLWAWLQAAYDRGTIARIQIERHWLRWHIEADINPPSA